MDKKELLDKFCLLLTESINSGEQDSIDVSLEMFKKSAHYLAETNIRQLKELVECYEGSLKYNNFLTENEAYSIVDKFINQDGTRGPRWRDAEELFNRLLAIGVVECAPHFNKWALYATVNMVSSDKHNVILKWIGDAKDKYLLACYDLALTNLRDKDRPCWIRSYFDLED